MLILVSAAAPSLRAAATPCGPAKMAELLDGPPGATVQLDCSVRLPPGQHIVKRLKLAGAAASGITIDCQGSTIESRGTAAAPLLAIHSELRADGTWSRPEDITVRNCTLAGNIRIWGMANGGLMSDAGRRSSFAAGHTQRARDAAPSRILFDHVRIVPDRQCAIYVSVGVTHFSLLHSEVAGTANSAAMYLDAESAFSVLEDNTFTINSSSREVLAIDGASDNVVLNNRFVDYEHGGIFLYRNCGEHSFVRHTPPERNLIVNNQFLNREAVAQRPAVYLGSRNRSAPKAPRRYCELDSGYPFGSSASDADHARYNVVMQNQIEGPSRGRAVRIGNAASDTPNYIAHNEQVAQAAPQRSGCFLATTLRPDFLRDGESARTAIRDNSGERCVMQRCDDGRLVNTATCDLHSVPFSCRAAATDKGCHLNVACPAGSAALGARAVCALGPAEPPAGLLAALVPGHLAVVEGAAYASPGQCRVGDTALESRGALVRADPRAPLRVACRKPEGSGDCEVRGTLFCAVGAKRRPAKPTTGWHKPSRAPRSTPSSPNVEAGSAKR